ncbi:ferredoxin--NADP reductase [Cupriavidus necator]|uniref:Ferredoxin:oxidoreductase FAD/NAD(P)-binding protein n=1 Tax=Cupriavidus necator TaxID=106590 RepID=A0A367PH94_CUPNE|nr:ferredoxin--NADP reductase [Cupriavidus necator]QQX87052.1 ferredoxin--NADP reductase [Cupriavidus necator]RCJ06924.1 ferredoxin:oxidoreductase FAD/NAD(P)-binding protein [Cupriavidus necator]
MQFHRLTVADVVEETGEARSYALSVPQALHASFRYRAGQHLTFRVNVDGEILTRSYSLSSSPEPGGLPVVTVKRVPQGRVSHWFHAHVRPGTVLEASVPTGRFVCDEGESPLVFCAAGSGITPVLSMIRSVLASTRRSITLFYANRDADSVIFGDAIARLAEAHSDRLELVMHYDDQNGYPEAGRLAKLLGRGSTFQLYLCGPAPFMATVQQAAAAAGVPGSHVHLERFDAAPVAQGGAAAPWSDQDCHARVTTGGTQHVVRVAGGQTLLQAALAVGLEVPYACKEGYCGSCAAKCVDGEVIHARNDVFNADDLAGGWILACQAHPRHDRPVAITFDV